MRGAGFRRISIALLMLIAGPATAQAPAQVTPAGSTTPEQRTAQAFEAARANPLDLHAFLARMPKGGDLHNHLSGAIYAETFIRDGAEDHLCVDLATHAFVKPPAATGSSASEPACGQGKVPAADAFNDQDLYDALVDTFSMRSFVPSAGVSGHDHFFATFLKFDGIDARHTGEWLDEVATRAAAQNEQYLELMVTGDFSHSAAIAYSLGWKEDLGQLRTELLEHGLREDVAVYRALLDQGERVRRERERCGQPDATPACKVKLRFLYQVLRGFPKQQVFAQTVLGFEVASADPRVVGINFVMPEDGYTSMHDYALHMRMVGFLHGIFPHVHISLHAGEIAPGLVTPEELCCHVRLAVEVAHAERIGHGVDLMYEDRPYELLKEMAAKHVMVETSLTSNDVILGISGKDHPFPIERKFGVPVALSTDDEGVSRIDMTHEYVRATETYGLRYADLKQLARTSLEHSFLPGASLWREMDMFTRTAAPCAKDALGTEKPSPACAGFLKSSEKAQQQWELEWRFHAFEASF
jgi:adenosine deaminase